MVGKGQEKQKGKEESKAHGPGGICQKEMAASLFLEIQVCIEYLGTRH